MEYVYAALILNEYGAEINEQNLTSVLEGAQVDVEKSRVKALVAALEDVDISQAVEEAAAVPASGGGGGAAAGGAGGAAESESEPDESEQAEQAEAEGGDDDDEDDEAAGEGLGELFG